MDDKMWAKNQHSPLICTANNKVPKIFAKFKIFLYFAKLNTRNAI